MSVAMRTIAGPVRLPDRVCRIHSRPCCTVNSMSCMSRKCCSNRWQAAASAAYVPGRVASIEAGAPAARAASTIGSGVRTPATTSSPCALTRYSPKMPGSPLFGSRVKQTPVAQSSPRLPKTIDCTVQAVPQSCG